MFPENSSAVDLDYIFIESVDQSRENWLSLWYSAFLVTNMEWLYFCGSSLTLESFSLVFYLFYLQILYILFVFIPRYSLVAQTVKNLPATQETWVQSLGREDLLEKEMANHSCILAWRIPRTEKPDGLQSMGFQRVGHNWMTINYLHCIYNYLLYIRYCK